MSALSLGIDLGTSGIRSAVVEADGQVVSDARAQYAPQVPYRINAEIWWQGVVDCLDRQIQALREIGRDPADITRIAVDGPSGSMVLTDAKLAPVTGALMYKSGGFDAEARDIAEYAPAHHITRGTSSALARALRLQAEDTQNQAAHLLHQADYIAAKLIGQGG